MISAIESGELLFTPRVGALYGYTFLWAMIVAVILKWFINHEIGRFAVCTGAGILYGFKHLPGPRNWALWLILLPQLLVAVATIAGLAGTGATALVLVFPGGEQCWTILSVLASTGLVLWGRYHGVERAATALALMLIVAALAAAVRVFPGPAPLTAGLVPRLPETAAYGEILPWLGLMLSGASGLMWYSYWLREKGYGEAACRRRIEEPAGARELNAEDHSRLRGWLAQMTLDNTVGVAGTLVVAISFLTLGAELLRPRGLVPDEHHAAGVLGLLMGEIWGPLGFWFMVLSVFVGCWTTILSAQDGFGRLFGDGTVIILHSFGLRGRWTHEGFWHWTYVVLLTTVFPLGLYLAMGRPINLLKLAGAVEAAHIPVVAGLTLYLNHRWLPAELRPSRLIFIGTVAASVFFALFAGFDIVRLFASGRL